MNFKRLWRQKKSKAGDVFDSIDSGADSAIATAYERAWREHGMDTRLRGLSEHLGLSAEEVDAHWAEIAKKSGAESQRAGEHRLAYRCRLSGVPVMEMVPTIQERCVSLAKCDDARECFRIGRSIALLMM